MGTFGGALRALSPHSLLRLYLAVVVCTAAVAIGAVLLTSSRIDSRSREASSYANAATAASQIQAGLRQPLRLMLMTLYSLSSSEQYAALSEEDRLDLFIPATAYDPASGQLKPLPDFRVPMTDRDILDLQRAVDVYSSQVDELSEVGGEVSLSPVIDQRDRLRASLAAYVDDDSATNFREILLSLVALGESLDEVGDQLALSVAAHQEAVHTATSVARVVMLVSLVAMAGTMAGATFYVGRLINRAFTSSETERKALRETTQTLQYRNDQLSALYAVFSEITDTLSMRYVINATLRETLHVMNASMVVLRLLQAGDLVEVGNLTSGGKEVQSLPTVPLGEGPTGRVARRGRSLRIGQEAQRFLGPSVDPDDPDSGVESGIIVPLIVGARVVGTLACWSKQPDAYTEEDEKVLEMMASQVATAVVAADHAETSERRALHDPLTGLPNRRQLTEDIANQFSTLAEKAVPAAVAMIDVDNFKTVNDDYGHKVGDVSLQKLASVMRNAMREGDRIYRYGGEEFVAVLTGTSGQDAIAAAERLRTAVETTPLTGDQLEPVSPITVSIGLAFLPAHGSDINDLIDMADKALYRAKQNGRNRIEVWQEDLQDSLTSVA